MKMQKVQIEDIEDGMLTAADVILEDGSTAVRGDIELESRHITLLKAAGVKEIEVIIPERKSAGPGAHVNDYPEHAGTLKNARVLIVDDSKLMRLKLRKIVEGAGLALVGEAEDGRDAIEKARELKPTFITLDIEMPEMDGISVIEPLLEAVPGVKIIMISSLGEDERIIESVSKGALDFIVKPFDPEKVGRALIRNIITNYPHI